MGDRAQPRKLGDLSSSPAFAGEGDQAKPGGGALLALKKPLHRASRGPPPPENRGRRKADELKVGGDYFSVLASKSTSSWRQNFAQVWVPWPRVSLVARTST